MWILLACAAPLDDTSSARGAVASDEVGDGSGSTEEEPTPEAHDTGGGADEGLDDALVVAADFPASLACGESTTASLSVENTGTSAWTRAALYKLGTVSDEDPLHASTRAYLDDDVVVNAGSPPRASGTRTRSTKSSTTTSKG